MADNADMNSGGRMPSLGKLKQQIEVLEKAKIRLVQESTVLRKTNERMVAILESISGGFFTLDENLVVTYFNSAAEKLLGRKREEVLGRGLFDSFPEASGSVFEEKYRLALAEKKHLSFETYFGLKPNENWYDVRVNPFESGITVYFQLITERKQAEEKLLNTNRELELSNKELEQFASVATHDLQEPLRMVASYVRLLSRRYSGKLDEDADEFIFYAVDGAKRMQMMLNDLLDYSRTGNRSMDFNPCDCSAVLKRVVTHLQVLINENEAGVTFDDLPEVTADVTQLIQLFQNLIINAIKFSRKEPPRIHITSRREGPDWVFSVKDNGIGIKKKYLDQIFLIFQCLHGRNKYTGTGIGLAICKKIVARHGGRMWVESEPGKGSEFFFTIPALVPIQERKVNSRGGHERNKKGTTS